jgi:hypothetical protein
MRRNISHRQEKILLRNEGRMKTAKTKHKGKK